MKGVDRAELNNATIVSYALTKAIFDALDEAIKERVKKSVLAHLPPPPNPLDGQPVDEQMWKRAFAELKMLAGQ